MAFNLDDYEPVATRIAKFYGDHPDGRILTALIDDDKGAPGEWIVKAAVYRAGEERPWATGFAHESPDDAPVNRTSALEVCETSAVGRALANAGYAGSDPEKRASREEMSKVSRGGGGTRAGGTPTAGGDNPTDKQRSLFFKLLDEKDVSSIERLPDIDALTKKSASAWIDTLMKLPDVEKAARGKTVKEATAALGGEVVEEVPLEAYSDEPF